MTKAIAIDNAGMLDDKELLIELSDGRVVTIDVEQVLSLHPNVVGMDGFKQATPSTKSPLAG